METKYILHLTNTTLILYGPLKTNIFWVMWYFRIKDRLLKALQVVKLVHQSSS